MNMKQWTTVIAAMGLVLATSGIAAAAGLLSHYKFDDNTLNSVIGSYDGTARGDVGYWPGDANGDKAIDSGDAAVLAANWLTSGANWSKGDFNADTVVDDKDATIMANNWGLTEVAGNPALPQYVAGKAGNALEFDETYYQAIDTTTSGYPNGTARSGTVSFWAKTTQPGGALGFASFLGTADYPNPNYTAVSWNGENMTTVTPGRLRMALRPHQSKSRWVKLYSAPIGEAGIDDWLDGEWHHIIFTWDAADGVEFQGAIYIDGVSQPLDEKSNGLLGTDTFRTPTYYDMKIGATGHNAGTLAHGWTYAPYDGLMDDVQIYDGIIQAADAVWLFNHPGEALAAAAAVPEPSMLILLCAAALMLALRRKIS